MHEHFMKAAIDLAAEGVDRGDGGPFGAVIVRNGEIIGRGWNRVVCTNDPTAHAEIIAIREACNHTGHYHIEGAVLYTSCEPCPMCLAAAYWAHIGQVFFAARGGDATSIGFDDREIRDQLKLDREQQKIPQQELMRPDALAVFQLWRNSDKRQPY